MPSNHSISLTTSAEADVSSPLLPTPSSPVGLVDLRGGTLSVHPDGEHYSYSYGPTGLAGLCANTYTLRCAVFASLGGLTFGYDQGVIANVLVMKDFRTRWPVGPWELGLMSACTHTQMISLLRRASFVCSGRARARLSLRRAGHRRVSGQDLEEDLHYVGLRCVFSSPVTRTFSCYIRKLSFAWAQHCRRGHAPSRNLRVEGLSVALALARSGTGFPGTWSTFIALNRPSHTQHALPFVHGGDQSTGGARVAVGAGAVFHRPGLCAGFLDRFSNAEQ